jgi:hypothetical protein
VGSKSRTEPRKFRQNLKNDQDGSGEIRKVSDSRLQDDVYQISGESYKPSSAGLSFNKKKQNMRITVVFQLVKPSCPKLAWLAEPTFLLEIPRTLMVPLVISIKFLAACIAPEISEPRPYFYFCHLLLYIINFFF